MNANSSTRLIQRFRRETSGNLAVIVGLSLLPLLGAVALAIDVTTWYSSRARLQSAADAAAIATAREMRLGATSPEALSAAAEATALSALSAYSSEASRASVSAVVNSDAHSVKVTIEHPLDRAFSRAFTDALAKVQVSATARVTGSAPICVVGLDESEQRTLNFEQARCSRRRTAPSIRTPRTRRGCASRISRRSAPA
ncbi:TadE/TadG family type IV pilus assembly protein [Pantanalinema rosaneae CENA516]|uniref:TadE/TadG family type IV pilus assembly protein n=1 Tax=Pantanalinema rosaneae TaxID=1620701 RepID=UPI003D6DE10F